MENNSSFVVFNTLSVEGGLYDSVIMVSAESMENAAEKLGVKLDSQIKAGNVVGWKLFTPFESYEPFTEEIVGSQEFVGLTQDMENGYWPGGIYVFHRAGVILHMINGEKFHEGGGSSYLAIIQPPQFPG